jgi:5'-nucleotidase
MVRGLLRKMVNKETISNRILLSNDDGIHSHGLKVLRRIAQQLSDDVWVVAPESEQSGVAHSLSLHKPLRIRKISSRRYAVNGTPTDCVVIAIGQLMKKKPTLLLSGVNYGTNIGEDVTYSGTVAATMEATLLGIPAIALSLGVKNSHPPKWTTAEHFAPKIIQKLLTQTWPHNVLININFPDADVSSIAGVQVVKQGKRNISNSIVEWVDPMGRPYYWLGGERDETPTAKDTDLSALEQNYISITPLHLDLTHFDTLRRLRGLFEDVA